ncbi:hypothetical protein NQZ68_003898 [Dissostichus eleginoides]|nr:hypothetical protein NQZ68_003898 [Dissostichus eleginoides]
MQDRKSSLIPRKQVSDVHFQQRHLSITKFFMSSSDGLRNPLQREQLSRAFMKPIRLFRISSTALLNKVELNCRATHQSPTLCESARCPVLEFASLCDCFGSGLVPHWPLCRRLLGPLRKATLGMIVAQHSAECDIKLIGQEGARAAFVHRQLKFFEENAGPERCDVSSASCVTDLDLTKLCWTSSSKRWSLASGTLP